MPSGTAPPPGILRILHLTDLHYGRGFNSSRWDDVTKRAPELKPHLVIITGDLVNSPYLWSLRGAGRQLEILQEKLAAAGQKPPLFVIPGNHDTRIFGLLPVVWIAKLLTALLVLAVGLYAFGYLQWVSLAIAALALIGLAGRFLCVREFAHYFKDHIPELPKPLHDLGIVLYPFDSATHATNAACGVIPHNEFVSARKRPKVDADLPYSLGLVHHHVLPIPYDSEHEPMMILKNAGAFLREAEKAGIRLVLSGHKHNQHFSRIMIEPEASGESTLAVLCTGTPTAGRRIGRFGFNFSVVDIYWRSDVAITRYHDTGGTFAAMPAFWVESIESAVKARWKQEINARQYWAKSVALKATLNSDGDAYRVNEISGFKHGLDEPMKQAPRPFGVELTIGQIERMEARCDSPGAMVQPKLDLLVRERRKQRGHIVFTKPITKDDDPVNFSWFYDSVNTYAMSEQQYPLMYPDSPNTNVEFIQLVPSIPVEEASIIINFPAGFTIEGKPWLSVLNADGTSVNRLETLYKSALLFDEKQNLISVRLPYAPLGLRYRVQWRLASTPPPSAGAFVQSLEGQANKTSSRLLQLARHRASNPLSDLLKGLADVACKEFNLADDEALVMNIMVFDPASKKFVVVAANFPADDERWDVKLDYGDGIAGRTYKMNRVTLFKKPAALKNKTPFYYVPAGGEAVEADGSNVPVEVLLSLPLWHPKQPGSIFGVLNIESRDPSSKLLDIQDDNVTTKFRQAVSKACFEAVNDLFLKP